MIYILNCTEFSLTFKITALDLENFLKSIVAKNISDWIRHIAITICPFRFAFSHLPRCGQLLQQKDRKNFTWNLCARFS